jgi:hypothetical protein
MKVIALKGHRYGDWKEVGTEYELNNRANRRLFKALGWVAELPPVPPVEKTQNTYLTAVVTADKEEKTKTTVKRTYNRRNLTAGK